VGYNCKVYVVFPSKLTTNVSDQIDGNFLN